MPKYMYIRHQNNPKQVLTVAYTKEGNEISVGYTMNRIVDNNTTLLDQRLRQIIGDKEFCRVQKAFFKKFKSDQHNRKIARPIALGRMEKIPLKGFAHTTGEVAGSVSKTVLRLLLDKAAEEHSNLSSWKVTLINLLTEEK